VDNLGHVAVTKKFLPLSSTTHISAKANAPTWQGVVRVFLRVLVGLWLCLVLAWAALHAFILPRVAENQTWLQQQASRALGVRVQVGALQVAGSWWLPWLQLHEVGLFDAQGREALHLSHVTLAFSPVSLLRGGFEQVVIDQPDLDIRRDAQGRVWVAGLPLHNESQDTDAADWFFSQNQFLIRQGSLRWQDDYLQGARLRANSLQGDAVQEAQAAVLVLSDVNVTVLNGWRQHDLRLDATPPVHVGARLSVRGQFEQPLLARAGDWQQWRGQMYADFPTVDISHLRQWIPLERGVSLQTGIGTLRAWVDVEHGRPIALTADVSLESVNVKLGADLQALQLKNMQGRVGASWLSSAYEINSQDLSFETLQGERWPGGDIRVSWQGDDARTGTFHADRMDLKALSQVAQRLPLPDDVHEALLALQPQGQANKLQIHWQRPLGADTTPSVYSAKGQLVQFSLQHNPQAQTFWSHWPGVENLNLDFEITQQGGKAKLSMQNGSLTLPMGLEDKSIMLTQANALGSWVKNDKGLQVQINQASLSNDDLSGEFSGNWKMGSAQAPFPGVLDLTANLSRVQAQRVHRYLPDVLSPQVRQYVQQAVVAGVGEKVKLRVRGDLRDMPFLDPKQGEFSVSAQVSRGHFAYVPPDAQSVQRKQAAWPALENIDGELLFERGGLHFKGKTHLTHAPNVTWQHVEVNVPSLSEPEVAVKAEGRGPLQEVLATVNNSALNPLIDGALNKALVNGDAELVLGLTVPVHQLDKTKITGQVQFKDNELQVVPGTPVLTRTQGLLNFDAQGFQVKDLKAKTLGGDVTLQGGLSFSETQSKAPKQLQMSGQLTTDGLRQAKEMGFLTRLALNTTGRANYQATLGIKRGQPELLISSDLKGMALNLPAPLNKAANVTLPLRIETQLTKDSAAPKAKVLQDVLRVSLGRTANATYVRDLSQPQFKVLSGMISVGASAVDSTLTRSNGVALNLDLSYLDADAWSQLLTQWTGVPVVPVGVAQSRPKAPNKNARVVGMASDAGNAVDYVPTSLAVRADQLKLTDRVLHQVVVGGSRVGELWRLNTSAQELNGAIELRPSVGNTPAQLYARLTYLNIPPSAVADVESMLSEQPSSIPALDIVVNDLTLRGKKLGRLEIDAVNQAGATPNSREWRLNKFNVTMPEATLTAKGDWAADGLNSRRTQLNFVLDVRDSGQLLTRLGTPNAVREGRGKLQGQLTWRGSPITLDYASMTGQINLNIEKGQFLKTEPGAARLLGVLNLQALPRRLTLDFNDVFSEGFAFDFFRGDVRIDQGIAFTNNLQMKGVAAGALIEGRADLARETQDLKVVVVPDINAGAASLYMATINPLVGLTSYLAQLVLSRPLVRAGTTEFRIDGTWSQPRVTEVN
jgi:uncharacterized protein (TIGR02099 family)